MPKTSVFIDMGEIGDQRVDIEYKEIKYRSGCGIELDEEACIEIMSVKWNLIDIQDDLDKDCILSIEQDCKDDFDSDFFAAIEEKGDRMRHPEIFD